jgi:hypothetical protein
MTFRFKLELTRVECLNEALNEWGKDEMRLFGFGISRKGHLFATGYRSLGSYHTGDVNKTSAIPMTLFERDLENDGLEVLFFFWLIEEDGGGVRDSAASLEDSFRSSFFDQAATLTEAQFPRECIPFTAFYKTILPFADELHDASTKGRNDEVFFPFDLVLRNEPTGPSFLNSTRELTLRRSKNLGDYLITLRISYHQELVFDPSPR